jgi:synaptobrevin family protein YKT6
MKIFAFAIMAWRKELPQPLMLANAFDLSSFGYFQRGSIREFIIFFCRMLMQRTLAGQRQTIEHENYFVHIHLRGDGLGSVAVCDSEYPQRVAYTALSKLMSEFHELHGETWPLLKADTALPFPALDNAIVQYQDPAQADKLTKIHEDLELTKSIVNKTLDSVLDRGTKLESLVKQSEDLTMQSKLFYQNASDANRCCSLM